MGWSMAFDATIPIPSGCEVYSSTSGSVSGGRLRWQGALSPDEGSAMELVLLIGAGLDPGSSVETTATVQFGGQGLVFDSVLPVCEGIFLPVVIDAVTD